MKPIEYILALGIWAVVGAAALSYVYDISIFSRLGIPSIPLAPIKQWLGPVVWVILFILAISPGILAYKDKDGKLASGWVMILGIGLSAVLLTVYFLALSAWMAFS